MEPSDLEIFNLKKGEKSTIIRLELAVSGSQVVGVGKEKCERKKGARRPS